MLTLIVNVGRGFTPAMVFEACGRERNVVMRYNDKGAYVITGRNIHLVRIYTMLTGTPCQYLCGTTVLCSRS